MSARAAILLAAFLAGLAGASPDEARADPCDPAGASPSAATCSPASPEGQWGVFVDGPIAPSTAHLGWAVEGWSSFVVVMLACDPGTRSVGISLDLDESERGPVVTRHIRHGAGTLTLSGRPPAETDGEGLRWMETIRSYDEIAPALMVPAAWILDGPTPVILNDPGADAAFRAFRTQCGIADR